MWTQIKVPAVFHRQSSVQPVENDFMIKSVRRSPPKLSLSKNDSMSRVLVVD